MTAAGPFAELLARWERFKFSGGEPGGAYVELAEGFMRLGEPLFAQDVAAAGLADHFADAALRHDVRLRQVLALALLRSGVPDRARTILAGLHEEGCCDGETLGLLAQVEREAWLESGQERFLRASLAWWLEGFRSADPERDADGAIDTGINAAATAMLAGDPALARSLAAEVRAVCDRRLFRSEDYRARAALGEAALILGEWEVAETEYFGAMELAGDRHADVASTRRQARLLLGHLGQDSHRFDHALAVPAVVAFTGYGVDTADRQRPGFPPELEPAVRAAIVERLDRVKAGFGYASAAGGADLVFLEAMLDRGGEIHVVLPCARDAFVAQSVAIGGDLRWVARFEAVLGRAARVVQAGGAPGGADPVDRIFANRMLDGLSRLRATALEADWQALAVRDGSPEGTVDPVSCWLAPEIQPQIIDLAALTARVLGPGTPDPWPGTDGSVPRLELLLAAPLSGPPLVELEVAAAGPSPVPSATGLRRELKAFLFADAVGYSALQEEQIPHFVTHFLGAVGDLIASTPVQPELLNTWGDALYMVFGTATEAGAFALALRGLAGRSDWHAVGLPAHTSFRIALHAGPAFMFTDPVTGRLNCSGTQVSRAARMEPITPAGEVYASEDFAVLAAAERAPDFRCDYVGRTPLAKGYGTFPTYHLRPS